MPITRGLICDGRPVRGPADLDAEQLRLWAEKLGAILNDVTDKNDRLWRQRYPKALPFHRFRRLRASNWPPPRV